MSIELAGKFLEALPPQNMKSRDGNDLVKQDIVIEMEGKYPKKVCITFWNDKAQSIAQLAVGVEVKVQVDIESREYNGKWYTNVKGWSVETLDAGAASAPAHTPGDIPPEQADDDLPF